MIRGSLFTRFFLEDGIRQTDAYRALPATAVTAFADIARRHWQTLATMPRPSEAETIQDLINPLLDRLAWHHLPQQTPGRGRTDIADALLFITEAAKYQARPLPSASRFNLGTIVVEHEARDTVLDRGGATHEPPSSQILRYLPRADSQSNGAVKFGLLTNGRFWRLYWADAPDRSTGFTELDLAGLLETPPPPPAEAPPDHWLRVFMLLFGAASFVPAGASTPHLIDQAIAAGRTYQSRVTAQLSEEVFNTVYPDLVAAIAAHDPAAQPADAAWLIDARESALRLLYRLLFLLYAEDRDLLPVHHPGYAPYSLLHLREQAQHTADSRKTLSARAVTWWPKLRALFDAIDQGDAALGVPPYNGHLFHDDSGTLLGRLALPDAVLAPLIDALSREGGPLTRRWINYRDLSVQQLGSIYERLLERDVVANGATVALRPNPFARKTTGSYYTPDELVQLILRQAIAPLLAERRVAFATKAASLATDARRKPERLRDLAKSDAAEAFVSLRVCDPAMGSGHFLVSLVDYLTAETLKEIAEARAAVTWADYRSPLTLRIDAIRAQIKANAELNHWPVRDEHLDDRQIIRRIILKRCVFGVDLNPMAVELAKLSLWLHSFTVGAPLSFLDHHLRCGDSLFGEFVAPVEQDLRARYGLVIANTIVAARQAAAGMARVEQQADADIAGVTESARDFAGVEHDTAPLRAFLDLYHAARWLPPENPAALAGRDILFGGGGFGDPVAIAAGRPPDQPKADSVAIPVSKLYKNKTPIPRADAFAAAMAFVRDARALAADRRFLHWQAAFPGVWGDWLRDPPQGGFDAVIGNPPWDRMKMQEVEWFAARAPHIARTERSADRDALIKNLRASSDPLASEFDRAAKTAERSMSVARSSGAYPLLSEGDINIYSLCVERAARLVHQNGIVGLIVPSGIAADKSAARFFASIASTGRLSTLYDFENRPDGPERRKFFPDVYYRFKFSAFVFGGENRRFAEATCAFYKTSVEDAETQAFVLTPSDFNTVNPNTGTAPIFRSKRDAELTLAVYRNNKILVDRRVSPPLALYPFQYTRIFDMANDSNLFENNGSLKKRGAYPLTSGVWEYGTEKWLPLYEGKMVQAFDHRAAGVIIKKANRFRSAMSAPAGLIEHQNPAWFAEPQFWVSAAHLDLPAELSFIVAFKDITSPTNTRSVIAAIIPPSPAGHTLPVLLPKLPDLPPTGSPTSHLDAYRSKRTRAIAEYKLLAPLMLANLNALAFDFVARQKIQGNHLTWYLMEQLPFIPPNGFSRRFGTASADQIIREDVLALTYTAHDLDAFARDLGHTGPPFKWDAEDRLRRRARLDALFFLLYGINQTDADYILSTFPILRAQEDSAYGSFRSRTLILNTMAALAAGRPDAQVAG